MSVQLDGETRLIPIIGDPIRYVKSPNVLSHTLNANGANTLCIPMQVPAGSLDITMRALSAAGNVDGILVTMPHKNDAVAWCSTLSETSRQLNTVSAIRRNPDGSWHGDTLDGLSFVRAQVDQGAPVKGARVLLIGAGGAGSATAIALPAQGAKKIVVHEGAGTGDPSGSKSGLRRRQRSDGVQHRL